MLTASYEARPYGVGSAMAMARARRLCPKAVIIGPQDVTGHDIEDFGDEWYLATPAGEEVHAATQTDSGSLIR